MIVVIRHGERADNSPFESEQKSVKLSYDPQLSKWGAIQSEVSGETLKRMLLKANPSLEKIVIVSSPFLRCLQTAQGIEKGLKMQQIDVFSQKQIGEMLRSSWFTQDVNSMITCKLQDEFSKSQFHLNIQGEFVSDENIVNPEYPEDKLGKFYDRFKGAYDLIIEKFLKTYDQSKTALIIVTHGFGVQVVLDQLNAFSFTNLIDYCCINLFDYRGQSPKTPNIMVKQFHEHLGEAEKRYNKLQLQPQGKM